MQPIARILFFIIPPYSSTSSVADEELSGVEESLSGAEESLSGVEVLLSEAESLLAGTEELLAGADTVFFMQRRLQVSILSSRLKDM